jgi:hypothetical protein
VIQLEIKVIARASRPGVAAVRDGALVVRLQSPPVEGAANKELIHVIAKTFGVAKRDVAIISGERSKLKRVAIATVDRNHLESVLKTLGIDPTELSS